MSLAYINGEICNKEEAKISIFDRGFLFGDGVYEVIPAFNRKLFLKEPHLERLRRSCGELNFGPVTNDFDEIFEDLLVDEKANDLIYYIQITRGQAKDRNHIYAEGMQPNVVAFLQPLKPTLRSEAEQGFSARLAREPRWNRCDIKATVLLPNVMHKMSAFMGNDIETIFYTDEYVTECTASNLFMVKGDQIITPPEKLNILRGVTRGYIIEQLKIKGENVIERTITKNELIDADEIWISSSTKNVLPVVQLDGKPVGVGKAGPYWSKAFAIFEQELGWADL
ncbi:MAG: aminotransferase class IV [Bdellovibrionales bacterium]